MVNKKIDDDGDSRNTFVVCGFDIRNGYEGNIRYASTVYDRP